MKKLKNDVGKFYQADPERAVILICLALAIPVGVALHKYLHHCDEVWIVKRQSLTTNWTNAAVFLTVWLLVCHVALCRYNKTNPLNFFKSKIKF